MTTIKVWGRRNSANVQKVMWTLGELGLEYEREDVAGSFGFPDSYAALNPNAVVPTIGDGDLTLWESNACVRYLARRYGPKDDASGSAALWSDNPKVLALADQWMDWQRSDYSQHFFAVFLNKVRLVPGQAKPELVAPAAVALGKLYEQLDARLANSEYLAGDELSMGDIPVGTFTYRYLGMDIERPELPNVQRWYTQLTQRPAYQRHVMIPFGTNSDEWLVEEKKNAGVQ